MNGSPSSRRVWLFAGLAFAASGGCGGQTTEPVADGPRDLWILNSTGQTLTAFSVGQSLSVAGAPLDLGAGFDGDALDVAAGLAVTTVSSFGGSRVVFVDLEARAVSSSPFPAPEGDLANPSAASFDDLGNAWVGGRGSDAVYRVRPGDSSAELMASDVGTFIEAIVPVGDRLYAVDANIDDEGGSYLPRGPGRVVVLSRSGLAESVIDLPAGAFNPTDAVEVKGTLIVLVAGSFDPVTFLPANDGALVLVDLPAGATHSPLALEANGISLEEGDDGWIYVTTTSDFETTSLLRFDPGEGNFDRGPSDPIIVRGKDGAPVDCWSATAAIDGRIVCATFSFAEAGRLVLAEPDGTFIHEVPSGFGTTDVAWQ